MKLRNFLLLVIFFLICIIFLDKTLYFFVKQPKTLNILFERSIPIREGSKKIEEKKLSKINFKNEKIYNFYDNRRFQISSNNFIKKEYLKVTNSKKIYFFGGSTTYGVELDGDEKFPVIIENKLNDKKKNFAITSYNAAYPGNNTFHSYITFLSKVLDKDVNVAIINHAINDLVHLTHSQTYYNGPLNRRLIVDFNEEKKFNIFREIKNYLFPNIWFFFNQNIVNHEIIKKKINFNKQDEWINTRTQKKIIDIDSKTNQFKYILEIFIESLIKKRSKVILIIQPSMLQIDNKESKLEYEKYNPNTSELNIQYEEFIFQYDHLKKVIRNLALENNITLVDLDKEMSGKKEYFIDMIHYSKQGSRKIAEILIPYIEKELIK